ncbi:MAG: DUF1858 domain-containing protein [Spirochaetes bacterium]|nr:DUF1858 domain-containing protein [Spirochaetota bacterium]
MGDSIQKDIKIRDLIEQHPASTQVFAAYGIGCIGCALAQFETLEQGLNAHGINADDFMKDLNQAVANG